MEYPKVHLALPSSALFQFPPSNDPRTLPAPAAGSSLIAPPFSVSPALYNAVLDVKVPITIAAVYAVTVLALNRYNKANGNKPWAISKTKAFFWFVVAHNIFLAVYSAWTFVGMWTAMSRIFAGFTGAEGLAGAVDSLCKIHGTSGLANAITYDPTLSAWISEAPGKVLLSEAGTPFSTDQGRLWNEGLAFYGWFFYLSKFYEVLDTAIILAKGKRSSTLQTYHHAGAMMCMWAGMRFMSAPIWMFVFVNSAIHAMMYTYYTLTAFSVPIPHAMKRGLTTMQIIQFLVGTSYAAIHSFVSYDIPVQVPTAVGSVSKAASSVASAAVTAAATAGVGSILKKLLFRAVGEEGVAENVNGAFNSTAMAYLKQTHHTGESFHIEYRTIQCVDTSGQTFAIWLNVLYLTPLTVLFVRFFVKSYLRRTDQKSSKPAVRENKVIAAEHAGVDALKGVERKMNGNQNGNGHLKGGEMNGNGHAKVNGKK